VRMFLIVFLAVTWSLTFSSCSDAAGEKRASSNAERKGAKDGMKTYYIGRFAIDVPEDFKLEVLNQKIRYAEVSDFLWSKSRDRQEQRNELWTEKISEVKRLPQPVDKKAIIVEEREIQGIGKWAKAVIYRGDYLIPKRMFWSVLVDYGDVGIWLKIAGTNNELMKKNLSNILTSYQFGWNQSSKNSFYLKYGAINLPYLEQEQSYARFEGHTLLKQFEIEMDETHLNEPKDEGLLGRLAAVVATRFAGKLDIEKIRMGERTLVNLKGEETILRVHDGDNIRLSFLWRFSGEKDSGEKPKIVFDMETSDDKMNEKINLWDAILKSICPIY